MLLLPSCNWSSAEPPSRLLQGPVRGSLNAIALLWGKLRLSGKAHQHHTRQPRRSQKHHLHLSKMTSVRRCPSWMGMTAVGVSHAVWDHLCHWLGGERPGDQMREDPGVWESYYMKGTPRSSPPPTCEDEGRRQLLTSQVGCPLPMPLLPGPCLACTAPEQ